MIYLVGPSLSKHAATPIVHKLLSPVVLFLRPLTGTHIMDVNS